MTEYRTVLPAPDARFYGSQGTYVATDEAIEKIQEVAAVYRNQDGSLNVVFEADDQYELAVTVKELESELNALQYWEDPLTIDRPKRVRK